MKLVQACLSARKDGESSFHRCVGRVKLVQACLNARGDEKGILSVVWRYYDAHTDLFRCQERWRKQFSPLCRCCEVRASPFQCQERARKQFSSLWER